MWENGGRWNSSCQKTTKSLSLFNQKIAQLLIENQTMQHIAHRTIYLNIISYKKAKWVQVWNGLEYLTWGDELGRVYLQEGEDELYRSRFRFLNVILRHSGRKNSSNHPKPLSVAILEKVRNQVEVIYHGYVWSLLSTCQPLNNSIS